MEFISVGGSTSQSIVSSEEARQELEAETWSPEPKRAAYSLAPQGFLSLLSYTLQDSSPKVSTAHQPAIHCVLLTGQLGGDSFSIEIPSSKVTLACVELTSN